MRRKWPPALRRAARPRHRNPNLPPSPRRNPVKSPGPGKKSGADAASTGNLANGSAQAKAPLAGAQADASGAEPEFRWPARGRIIQGFKTGGNDGINISVPTGTSVRAAENGVVVYSGDGLKGYGNLVLIKHPNGFVSAYANNGELDVKRGETVKRGQVIAKSGELGRCQLAATPFRTAQGIDARRSDPISRRALRRSEAARGPVLPPGPREADLRGVQPDTIDPSSGR